MTDTTAATVPFVYRLEAEANRLLAEAGALIAAATERQRRAAEIEHRIDEVLEQAALAVVARRMAA
jgi:hypothetical protein